MNSLLELADDISLALVDPKTMVATARAEGRGLGQPLIFVLLFSAGAAGGLMTPLAQVLAEYVPSWLVGGIGFWSYAIAFTLVVGFGFVLWLVDSLLMHALSLVLGGRGSLVDAMTAIGYGYAALWPLAFFGALGVLVHWFAGFALLIVGAVLALIWRVYCLSCGLAEAEGFDVARGFIVVVVAKIIEYIVIPVVIGVLHLIVQLA